MFTVKGIKDSGAIHGYSCQNWVSQSLPGNVEQIDLINSISEKYSDGGAHGFSVYVSDKTAHYQSVYIENSSGKTVHAIHTKRGSK